MCRDIDPAEVARDLTNWLDATAPDWRTFPEASKRDLLGQAVLYFADVSRRYRIPEAEFLPALETASRSVRSVNGF